MKITKSQIEMALEILRAEMDPRVSTKVRVLVLGLRKARQDGSWDGKYESLITYLETVGWEVIDEPEPKRRGC